MVIEGAVATTTVRLAVLLGDPAAGVCVLVAPEVVLLLPPRLVLVTTKVTVQAVFVPIEIPLKLTEVAPTTKDDGVVPVQVPPTVVEATLMLTNVSLSDTLLNAVVPFGLLMFRVTVEVAPA